MEKNAVQSKEQIVETTLDDLRKLEFIKGKLSVIDSIGNRALRVLRGKKPDYLSKNALMEFIVGLDNMINSIANEAQAEMAQITQRAAGLQQTEEEMFE